MNQEWDFRFNTTKKTRLKALQAAKYLGLPSVFELSTRAFKNEIPAHFNAAKARLIFYKEELDDWLKMLEEYECMPSFLHPDKNALKGQKLEKVDVAFDGMGNYLPSEEVVKGEVEKETVAKGDGKNQMHVPNVEEIIVRFNKEAVIKRSNESEIFEQIQGNKKNSKGAKKRKKEKENQTAQVQKTESAEKETKKRRGRKKKSADSNQNG